MAEELPPSDKKPATAGRRVPTPEQRRALQGILERVAKGADCGPGFRFNRQEIYDERMDELERRRNAGKPTS